VIIHIAQETLLVVLLFNADKNAMRILIVFLFLMAHVIMLSAMKMCAFTAFNQIHLFVDHQLMMIVTFQTTALAMIINALRIDTKDLR
jgi:hypothetical protein